MTSINGLISANYLIAPLPMNLYEKIIKNNSNIDILSHLIWLISHLSSESIDFRNLILNSSIYTRILGILQQNVIHSEILRQGCWLFGNLMRGKPSPSIAIVI